MPHSRTQHLRVLVSVATTGRARCNPPTCVGVAVPENNPGRRAIPDGLMRIPFLMRADETIENTDGVLLPILDGLMTDAMGKSGADGLVETGVGAFPGWVM